VDDSRLPTISNYIIHKHGLRRGEYHLHDKDWNPIRFDQKGNAVKAEQSEGVPAPDKRFPLDESAEKASEPASGVQENSGIKMPDQRAIVEKDQPLTVYEENVLPSNTIMLFILAFLMLIILIIVRKRREKE
jgi:hypothetical protein